MFKLPADFYPTPKTKEDAPETSSNKPFEVTTGDQSDELVTIDDESGEYDIDDGGKIYPPPSLQSKNLNFFSN